jgi:hypothetical protein
MSDSYSKQLAKARLRAYSRFLSGEGDLPPRPGDNEPDGWFDEDAPTAEEEAERLAEYNAVFNPPPPPEPVPEPEPVYLCWQSRDYGPWRKVAIGTYLECLDAAHEIFHVQPVWKKSVRCKVTAIDGHPDNAADIEAGAEITSLREEVKS